VRQDRKSLLAQAVILLWRENQIEDNEGDAAKAVKNLIDHFPKQDDDDSIESKLKSIVKSMIRDKVELEAEDFSDTVRLACNGDEATANIIHDAIHIKMEDSVLKRNVTSMIRKVNQAIRDFQFTKLIGSVHRDIAYGDDDKSVSTIARDLIEKIEPFSVDLASKDKAIVDEVVFDSGDNEAKLEATMETAEERSNGTIGYKTGWQDLNEALGGCLREGYLYMVEAMKHNYKTGFCLSLFSDILINNIPKVYDDTKKPAAVWITLEDEVPDNVLEIYKRLKSHDDSYSYLNDKTSSKERVAFVLSKLTQNGWTPIMLRVNPGEWGYIDLQNKILDYEAKGFEIKICFIDYLNLLDKKGCTSGASGQDVRDLFRRVRNFFSARKTTVVTPHQLSTEALLLLRDGRRELAKAVVGKDYTADSRQICQDVDTEIAVSIEKGEVISSNGQSLKYCLNVAVGKNRKVYVNEIKKSFVLPFVEGGPILADIDKDKSSFRSLSSFEKHLNETTNVSNNTDMY
jgi:hypothetical protein